MSRDNISFQKIDLKKYFFLDSVFWDWLLIAATAHDSSSTDRDDIPEDPSLIGQAS